MNNPAYWGRPYFQAVRFGESHDMVSAQNPANLRIAARPPFGFGYQMAKAMGTLTLLSNGTPMLFMGQEIGETAPFSFPDNEEFINPQNCEFPAGGPTDQTRILAWFRQLMGLPERSVPRASRGCELPGGGDGKSVGGLYLRGGADAFHGSHLWHAQPTAG